MRGAKRFKWGHFESRNRLINHLPYEFSWKILTLCFTGTTFIFFFLLQGATFIGWWPEMHNHKIEGKSFLSYWSSLVWQCLLQLVWRWPLRIIKPFTICLKFTLKEKYWFNARLTTQSNISRALSSKLWSIDPLLVEVIVYNITIWNSHINYMINKFFNGSKL